MKLDNETSFDCYENDSCVEWVPYLLKRKDSYLHKHAMLLDTQNSLTVITKV